MLGIEDVATRVKRLQERYSDRDARMRNVALVRAGKMVDVFPEFFSGQTDQPVVANLIDVAARDLSEAIGQMPSLTCASGVITSDRSRRFAARRQRIGSYYWESSNLALQMFSAVDNYLTNGFVAAEVEPCYRERAPKIRFLASVGSYPELDPDGECLAFARTWTAKASVLAELYPEHYRTLLTDQWGKSIADRDLDVVKYIDKTQSVLYVPKLGNLILDRMAHDYGCCPVVVAVRPSSDGELRGQFDDILGVQAARALMMRLQVEAAEKQVQAPIAIPDDVVDLSTGSDAYVRSATPQNIRRVDLNVGDATFREAAQLNQELLTGARFPEGRIGNSNASVITGRGVEALMGGYDSQVKTAQTIFAHALRRLTAKCFEMDERLFGSASKTIRGTVEGTPFEEEYTPSKDIKGDYTCEVTYGFLAGMDPNRALVFLLQLRGDKLIPRETVQKQMPFDVDTTALQQNVDVEEMRDALKQGVLAYVQAIGPMAAQGQDPSEILQVLASAIKGRQQGKPLEDLLEGAFEKMAADRAAKQQEQMQQMLAAQSGASGMPGAPGAGSEGGSLPGVGPEGLLTDVASGQAGMGPGGRPSVQSLMAGLGSDGNPAIRASVQRQIAA